MCLICLAFQLVMSIVSMGGIRSFFIEVKLFQLVVEEGGNFFSLHIFKRGKHFMKSVFMDKNAALWLMKNQWSKSIPNSFLHLEKEIPHTLCNGDQTPLVNSF